MAKLIQVFLFTLSIISTFSLKDATMMRNTTRLHYDWVYRWNGEGDWLNMEVIPHDLSIVQKFDERNEAESGFLPGGTIVYRKYIGQLPVGKAKFVATAYFFGVYKDGFVYVNDEYVGENIYAYAPFSFDITPYLKADVDNHLDIRVENPIPSSRWYPGGGLFRDVDLIITNPVHIAMDGLKILTPDIEQGKGTVKVQAEVQNQDDEAKDVLLNIIIKEKGGEKVAELLTETAVSVGKGETKIVEATLTVEKPKLWIDTEPNLYELTAEVVVGEEIVDRYMNRFGFRWFKFDKDKGFSCNGQPRKLHGFSQHLDYGAIGSIDNYDAAKKRFKQLQELGGNSIRTTHNPTHRTWIDLCEEMGIFVVEEFFDCWDVGKGNRFDFGGTFHQKMKGDNHINFGKEGMEWAEFLVKATMKRDRNSPAIIMWSIGNELPDASHHGELAKTIILWGKQIDDTRVFTIGENCVDCAGRQGRNQAIVDAGGIIGMNYGDINRINGQRAKYGCMYYSESDSIQSSRGVYCTDENGHDRNHHDGAFHLTSYDSSAAAWGTTIHQTLYYVLNFDYLPGQYVWTLHDYIGEPTPWNGDSGSKTGKGAIPNSSYFGTLDTANFPKDAYYLFRSQLRRDSHTVNLVTAWDKANMKNNNGKTPVWVYTSVKTLEIYRSDKDKKICTVMRDDHKTDLGFRYHMLNGESNDGACEFIKGYWDDEKIYARFNIEWKEGTKLYTKAFDDDGKEIDTKDIHGRHIAYAPNRDKLQLDVNVDMVDKEALVANGKSLAFIEVSIVDDTGMLDTKGANLVTFDLEGEGKILGVDNGDEATVDKFQNPSIYKGPDSAMIKAYAGKCMAIVSSTRKAGTIKLTVASDGLGEKVIEIKSE